jgi:T-complex protein 1 subunit eta
MDKDKIEKRDMLKKCAATALNSKLIASNKDFFSEMIVKAVESLDSDLEKSFVGIKKVTGGSVTESFLVEGVAFKKTFSYAGFEQQPKSFKNPQILILNLELELKSEKENAEIRLEKPEDFQKIVDAEWSIIYDKLEKCVASGAQIVLSKLPIGDLATQYFADRNIFCAGRVQADDLLRVAKCSGGTIQTTVNGVTPDVMGTCGEFEEVQLGGERYNLFKHCK